MKTLKKTQPSFWWLLTSLVIIVGGCTKKIDTEPSEVEKNIPNIASLSSRGGIPYQEGNVILGSQKLNPYTVTNMTSAWAGLASAGVTTNAETSVHRTHYYVKFKPQNYEQYEALQLDTTLTFSDFPIESNIVQNGNRYHDPSLPDSVPTYQYTAVKENYQFSDNIPYEIIDDLYIPEVDELLQYQNGGSNDIFVDKLLNKAYTLTGNFEDTITIAPSTYARGYNPGGRIQIFDTRLNSFIGMEGVIVRARRWFVVYAARPDYNGFYRMPFRFVRPCNYSIWFDSPTFNTTEHLFGLTCWINGPKISGDWNYNINDGYDRFVGHIFRGAYRYNFKDIGGLLRPYLYTKRQQYIARNELSAGSGINWVVFPVIRIARFDGRGSEYQSDEIFSTTCHETGHSSHFKRMGSLVRFILVSARLRESWAVAIEWHITNIEYVGRGIPNYGKENYFPTPNPPGFPNSYAYQYWNSKVSNDYTPIYIDIVDDHNQFGQPYFGFENGSINDGVHDYSLQKIEMYWLRYINRNIHLRAFLKSSKPSGVTDVDIDLLIDQY